MESFIHYPQYRLIKCPTCPYTVLPREVETHLASKKHGVSAYKRREIMTQIMKIPDLIQDQGQLEREFQTPAPGQNAVAGLPIYSDGVRCLFEPCAFVCRASRTNTGIKEHCRDQHQWVNPYGRGGSMR